MNVELCKCGKFEVNNIICPNYLEQYHCAHGPILPNMNNAFSWPDVLVVHNCVGKYRKHKTKIMQAGPMQAGPHT